jgi:hypothetical protein
VGATANVTRPSKIRTKTADHSSNPAMISRQCLRIFEREHGGTTCIVVW